MQNLRKIIAVFLSILVACIYTYCNKTDDNSINSESQIKIGVLFCAPDADIVSELTEEWEQTLIHSYEQSLDTTEARVNSYLEKAKKEYRISYELLVPYQDEIIDYSKYDIIKGENSFSLYELEDLFLNLENELTNGRLIKVYESMPEKYWDSVKVNGKIYNLNRTDDAKTHVLQLNQNLLNKYGLNIPENLIGEPLWVWESFFQTIYDKNGNVPFLLCPFDSSYDLGPFLGGNVWNTHFQLVTPFLGISYEEPEKGVQCIYESSYAKKMNETWGKYQEAGYITYQGFFDNLIKNIEPEKLDDISSCIINSCAGCDLGMTICVPREYSSTETDVISVGLQSKIYNVPEPIGMTSVDQVLVTTQAQKKERVFEFLTDMHTDAELMIEVNQTVRNLEDKEENEIMYTISLCAAASVMEEVVEYDRGLFGSYQEKNERQQMRIENLSSVPAPGFVGDTRHLETSLDEIVKFLEKENDRLKKSYNAQTSWIELENEIDKMVEKLYDMGLQKIIDELNRQLGEYMKGRDRI